MRCDEGSYSYRYENSDGKTWVISNNQVNFAATFHTTDEAIYLDFSALSNDGKVLWTEYEKVYEIPKNKGVIVQIPPQAKNGGGGGIKITTAPQFHWPPTQTIGGSGGGKKKTINPNEGTTIFFPDDIKVDLIKGNDVTVYTGNANQLEEALSANPIAETGDKKIQKIVLKHISLQENDLIYTSEMLSKFAVVLGFNNTKKDPEVPLIAILEGTEFITCNKCSIADLKKAFEGKTVYLILF